MADFELKNESDREFEDISTEEYRKYIYTYFDEDGNDVKSDITIDNPQWLSISDSGHYVVDSDGDCWFIPSGWNALMWHPKTGAPHVVA